MPLTIADRLKHKVTYNFAAALKPDARVELGTDFYCELDDGGESFFRAYEKLRAAGNNFFTPMVNVCEDDADVFPEDRKHHMIGYLARSLDRLWLRNPAGNYHQPPMGACRIALKEDVEMDLEERPKELFVSVADEFIAHDDWLEYFASPSLSGVKPVRYKGKVLEGWNRLQIHRRQPILADFCFATVPCAICARPLVTDFNDIWFSSTFEPVEETIVNDRGTRHFGGAPCIILSVDAVKRFCKKRNLRRAGLRPLGVYSPSSRRYEIFKKIDERTKHLRDEALEELKTAQPNIISQEAMQELGRFMSKYFGH